MLELIRAAVLVILALSIGAVAAVCGLYARTVRLAPPRRAGLTPLHVAVVSLGVLTLEGALAWAQVDALGGGVIPQWHVTARTVLFGVGSLLVLAGIAVIAHQQQRRVHFCRAAKVTVETTDTTQVHPDSA